MAHFFGRLFKKNTRKGSPSPAYFEALESRQLLSATFEAKDFNGTWAILNHSDTAITGTFTVDGTGAVTGSTVEVGGVSVAAAKLAFTVNSDGTVKLESTLGGSTFLLDLGRVNSNKSVVSLDDAATGDTTMLVKKDATVTKDELKGTWSFATDGSNGTIVIGKNASGNLFISSAVFKDNGQTVAIDKTGSSISADGSGNITLVLKTVGGVTMTFTGVKADSAQGDVLAFQDEDGVLSVAIKQDAATKFATTDLAAGDSTATWFATGSDSNGTLTVSSPDTKGLSSVSGNLKVDVNGVVATVAATGKLKLNANGSITGTLNLRSNPWMSSTISVTGRMNLSKNVLELHTADGSFFVTLTTSADHATTIANSGKTVSIDGATNVTGGKGITIAYADLLTAMGLTDIDGDSQDTLTLVLKSGSLTVNGVAKTGTVTLNKGDALMWFTDSTMGAGAKVIGFTVKVPLALDAAATSIRFVHVANAVTLTTPAAIASATDAKVVVTRTDTSGAKSFRIDLNSDGMKVDDDYSLALASTDTGKATLDVDDSGDFATVTLNDKVASVTILVKNKAVTNTGSRIVTLSLASVAADAGFEISAAKNSVNITVAGTHAASAAGVSVTGPISVTEGANGVFTITSTKAAAADQDIKVTVSGITGRYSLEYSSDGKTGWTPTILTGDATTVKLAKGKTKVYVRIAITDDATVQGDKSASLAIDVLTNNDKFYVNEATSMVDFTAKDNEQQVTVTASAATVNEGKSATFTISVPNALNADTTFAFKLGGTALLSDSDYTVSGTGVSYDAGTKVYSVTILKGAKSAVIKLAATADTKRTEGDETVVLTMESGKYIVPASPTTITIKDVTAKTAPTLSVTSAKLPGDFVKGSVDGTSVTVASLIAAAKATDLEDGTTLSIKITKIQDGVTLKVDGSAIAEGDIVANGKTIVVFIGSTVVAPTATQALFSGQFQDSEDGLTAKIFAATGNVPANAGPEIVDSTGTLTAIDAGATDKTVTHQNLLDATGALDPNGDPIIFVITSIADGITLTKNAGKTAIELGKTEISSTDFLNLPVLSAVSTGTELFTVKVKDASHTTLSTSSSVISIAVNNTAPTATSGTIPNTTTFSKADLVGTTVSAGDLITVLQASDQSDDTNLSFKITKIEANVSLEIGGQTYTSVSDLTNVSLANNGSIKVIVTGALAEADNTALFSVKAVDLNNALSDEVIVSGKVTA